MRPEWALEAALWFAIWVLGAYLWDAARKTWFPSLPPLGQIG